MLTWQANLMIPYKGALCNQEHQVQAYEKVLLFGCVSCVEVWRAGL